MECESCKEESILDNFNPVTQYFYCKKCIKKINIISKSKCQKFFILDDTDLITIKSIYSWNSNYKYYKLTDIEKAVIKKYGSIENLNKIIIEKQKVMEIKKAKIECVKLEREIELKKAFEINKLAFQKNHGDCYSYIHYGKPDINTILFNEIVKLDKKNKRRMELSSELEKHGIPYDESVKHCYNYVNGVGTNDILDVVRLCKNNIHYKLY